MTRSFRLTAPDADMALLSAAEGRWACAVERDGDRWLAVAGEKEALDIARERFPETRVVSLELAAWLGRPTEMDMAEGPALLATRAGERILVVVMDEGLPRWGGSCSADEENFHRLVLSQEERSGRSVVGIWADFPLERIYRVDAATTLRRVDEGVLERGIALLRHGEVVSPEEAMDRVRKARRKKKIKQLTVAGALCAVLAGSWGWLHHRTADMEARAELLRREAMVLARRVAVLEKATGWSEIERHRPRFAKELGILLAVMPPGWNVERLRATSKETTMWVSPPKDRPVSFQERAWARTATRKMGETWRVESWKQGFVFRR